MIAVQRNILLLSAGRRVELLKAFKTEVQVRGLDSRVFAADANPSLSAACHLADKSFCLPRASSNNYVDRIFSLCQEQGIRLVIPTIDTELLGLARARESFERAGIEIVISDERFVAICRDKRESAWYLNAIGIDTPKILDRKDLSFPCFVKPFDGSRSVGAAKLAGASELTDAVRDDPKMIFLEYIDSSFHEYTVDAYFDRRGELKCIVPRRRLEVRDGEVSKAVTVKGYLYDYLVDRIHACSGARGCITFQLFMKPDGSQFSALEINPRFGGGFPLSYLVGANYPGWLIDEYLLDKSIDYFDGWHDDMTMLRFDSQVLARGVR